MTDAISEPIVMISRHRVKPGRLEEFREFMRQGAVRLKAANPRTTAVLGYVDDSDGALTIIHVFPDADAMDEHMKGVAQRTAGATEYLEFGRFEIYGRPSEAVREFLYEEGQAGIGLSFAFDFVAGFVRPDPVERGAGTT